MPAPLAGYRVVDFSRVLAGPHCAKTLLDLGADVIKVEPPRAAMSRSAYPRRGEFSGYYAQQNAGKRNLSIDLKVPGANEVALRLCDTADVIVENFRPGTLAAFGLDYPSVAARDSRVVYASISGYGQQGAWSARMAYAPTVQAETGFTQNTAAQFGGQGTTGEGRLRYPGSRPPRRAQRRDPRRTGLRQRADRGSGRQRHPHPAQPERDARRRHPDRRRIWFIPAVRSVATRGRS